MKELPENKLIKRQVFLQKSQNQFISEVHEAIKIVPHVLISINCLGKFTFGSRSMYWLHVIPSLFAICVKFHHKMGLKNNRNCTFWLYAYSTSKNVSLLYQDEYFLVQKGLRHIVSEVWTHELWTLRYIRRPIQKLLRFLGFKS